MQCPRCDGSNAADAGRCAHCGAVLARARLDVVRGDLPDTTFLLTPRTYTVGRARHNDLSLPDASVSKAHARIEHDGTRFFIEDTGSLHGVYVDAVRVQRAELGDGAQIQLGNITLRFSSMGPDGHTTREAEPFPWVEQQQLLLSLVRALNSAMDAGTLGTDDVAVVKAAFDGFDRVLGILSLRRAEEALPPVPVEEIDRLIEERHAARRRRDFAEADRIRHDLLERGIILEDSAGGTRWKRK